MRINELRALARRATPLLAQPPSRALSSRGGRGGQRNRHRHGDAVVNAGVGSFSRVRLVQACGKDGGEMSGASAVAAAERAGLDVLLVARGALPVVKLLDYSALQRAQRQRAYQRSKDERSRSRDGASRLKQVRLSPATDPHDRELKLRQARAFLQAGYRVRIFMIFRRGHGRLRAAAEDALVDAARELAPDAILRGVPDVEHVRDLFKAPEPEAADSVESNPQRRTHRPLEIVLDPLPKRIRERNAQAAEAEAAAQSTDSEAAV